jgi:hypothetical protein
MNSWTKQVDEAAGCEKTCPLAGLRSVLPGQPGRPAATANRTGDGRVDQRHTCPSRAKHQSAAAHVAAPDEFGRKQQRIAKNAKQRLDVFGRRDAAKKHDLAGAANLLGQSLRVALERIAVAPILLMNWNGRNLPQVRQSQNFVSDSKPRDALITDIPGAFSGGWANARAYSSFPRKYSPLMN